LVPVQLLDSKFLGGSTLQIGLKIEKIFETTESTGFCFGLERFPLGFGTLFSSGTAFLRNGSTPYELR
jgi:hypothetical protein